MAAASRTDTLEKAHAHYESRNWEAAFRLFEQADAKQALEAGDVECLARAAYMMGMEDVFLEHLERAHKLHASGGQVTSAARTAFWLGITLMFQGEVGSAMGWFARAQRTLEGQEDCAERGYLLLPKIQKCFLAGEFDEAFEGAEAAASLGTRFEDRDLIALARHFQGRIRLAQGHVDEGLALLDETMIAVTGGELSARTTGMIYCSVVEACQEVFALDRAREWTSSLARWCNEQESLVTFTGTCLVHRAQVLQVAGAWEDAENEVERARERLARLNPPRSAGWPLYELAELHRLRGSFEAAEQAFEEAAKQGYDPQPGLALLRVTQGRAAQALASVKRALASTSALRQRARYLPAAVEICIAAGDVDEARAHSEELETIATTFGTPALRALADDASAAIDLATGNAAGALTRLERAAEVWQAIPAPYAHARTRSNIARACKLLGDTDGCALAFEAARAALKELGAQGDLSALDAQEKSTTPDRPAGLTARELEVLKLVATGKPSKAIAQELYLSIKTVDRHLSNIFTKLGVASRAEATARAYQLHLL